MAIKTPIIAIDLDDSAFQRFSALFARYQAQLKEMPGQWKSLGDEVDAVLDKAVSGAEGVTAAAEATAGAAAAASVSFRQTFIAVGGTAEQMEKASGASRGAATSARSQASAWHDMARSARSFAGQIGDATRSLLRWAGLTGLISGILGAGGLFGIDRLANAAGNARKSALGIGTTAGEQNAFEINYGRVLSNPDAFLSGLNNTLTDYTKRGTLYGVGLSEGDLTGKNTTQVAQELIPALKRLVDQYPKMGLEQLMTSFNLGNLGITKDDLQRIQATPAAEIAGYGKSYQRDAQALDLNQQQLTAWQNLQVQLARAGATIEKAFIVGLAPLAPQFERLSAAFTKLVSDVLSSGVIKEWVDKLATGMEWLGTHLGSQEFHDAVLLFLAGADAFGKKVLAMLPTLDQINAVLDTIRSVTGDFGDIISKITPALKILWQVIDDMGRSIAKVAHFIVDAVVDAFGPLKDWWNGNSGQTRDDGSVNGNSPQQPDGAVNDNSPQQPSWLRRKWYALNASPDSYEGAHKEEYQKLETDNGLPSGFLNTIERRESGFKDVLSPAGAQGFFQHMPATAGEYNVNPHDEISSATGTAHFFRKMMAEFKGDIAKAAAGYNWGPGNVERDIAQYGDKWREHLPDETTKYVNYVTSHTANTTNNNNAGGGSRATITINNATGGNATVSSSQLVN